MNSSIDSGHRYHSFLWFRSFIVICYEGRAASAKHRHPSTFTALVMEHTRHSFIHSFVHLSPDSFASFLASSLASLIFLQLRAFFYSYCEVELLVVDQFIVFMSLLSSLFPFLLRFHVPVFSFGHVVIFRFFCFLPLFSFLSLPY